MDQVKRIQFHSMVSEEKKREIINEMQRFCTPVVSDEYEYYFARENIYYNLESMRELLDSKTDAIRIMTCGEDVYPDMNLFDYAVWHLGYYECEDRIIVQPLGETLRGYLFDSITDLDSTKKNISSDQILSEKTKFCNFMYSNPNAHPMRDRIFYAVSEYKRVDSLGRHLKNVDIKDSRFDDDWYRKSVSLKRPYKFTIAAENASFPGETSEKLMTSMMANTIPLYFGNPYVADIYNSKSFIDVNSFPDLTAFVKYVAEVDQDDALYCSIMDEPWRTEEQIKKYQQDVKLYVDSFERIFMQDFSRAKRRPHGTWPDLMYPNIFRYQEEIKTHRFRGYLKKTADKLAQALKGGK